ncbi:MAG: ABC transporter substrate-binding protein [Acetobacteraceae bacterium]
MSRLDRRGLVVGAVALAAAAVGTAGASSEAAAARASAFIEARGQELVAVLDSDLAVDAKRERVAAILREAVDVRGVAQFVLGRHWRTATEPEREEYLSLFEATLIANLSARFGELRGVTFSIGRVLPRGEEGVMVSTTVARPGQQPVALDWLVGEPAGRPRIIDLVAEGTSLRITQRSEYGAIVQRSGGRLQPLLDAMRRQLARIESNELAQN